MNFGFQILDVRFVISGFRFQVSDFRFWISDFRFGTPDFEFWISDFGCQIWNFRFWISGFGFQISDSFQMSDFKFRFIISDLSSRLLTLQFKVQLVLLFVTIICNIYSIC